MAAREQLIVPARRGRPDRDRDRTVPLDGTLVLLDSVPAARRLAR
ncbi:MAG: hypothetical protein ACYC4P_04155 [Thermoanaerobaculia bacterium]